jgi:hypothetical protein
MKRSQPDSPKSNSKSNSKKQKIDHDFDETPLETKTPLETDDFDPDKVDIGLIDYNYLLGITPENVLKLLKANKISKSLLQDFLHFHSLLDDKKYDEKYAELISIAYEPLSESECQPEAYTNFVGDPFSYSPYPDPFSYSPSPSYSPQIL